MTLKLWNNLLKFLLLRLLGGCRETLHAAYRFCVRMLRKANRRVIRFSWLQRLINQLFLCPQMVQRYVNPTLSIEEFFSILNKRGIRYTILRWFEELPKLKKGDDIDMLVHDDDLVKIKDLFVALPTGTSCDIYGVSALPGASYRKGIPLYPSHLARELLETSVMYKDNYRVPDPRHYFLSLAYHAVYHKAETSGLAYGKDKPLAAVNGERSYSEKIVALGESCGVKVSPDLESLCELLTEHGWVPRMDVLRRIAEGSQLLTTLVAGGSSKQLLPKGTFRYPLNVHGVRVVVESNCARFMDYVRRDYCFFHDPNRDADHPHVEVRFLKQAPPWEEIPRRKIPLFKTSASTVYKQGASRYIDHGREVLSIYDLNRDQGTVYSDDPDAMYRVAYSLLMTRIGLHLDAIRRHRMHALGISLTDHALLFLGEGGTGKTTLGFEMMKHPQVGWLTDDILPVDSSGRALAFPTSPRLIEGSVVPWLPPSVNLVKAPMPRHPPKVQLPSASLLPRVCFSAKLGGLFLCRRKSGVGPSIQRVGFLEAFRGICNNALTGPEFGHMMAYHLQFSPLYLYRMAAVYFSRVRAFLYLAWTVPVFRFDMGGQIPENAALVLSMYSTKPQDEAGRAANGSSHIDSIAAQ